MATWIVQRVATSEAALRFYSPRSWAVWIAALMILFFAAAIEAVRRGSAPAWILIPVLLLTAGVVFTLIVQYRSSPDGILHFEVSRTGVSFDGFAFCAVASAPYSALKQVFVGDRYAGLVAPVLFEFHAPAFAEHGLVRYRLSDVEAPVILYSYRGLSRVDFEAALNHLLPAAIPVIRFEVADQLTQLPPQPSDT